MSQANSSRSPYCTHTHTHTHTHNRTHTHVKHGHIAHRVMQSQHDIHGGDFIVPRFQQEGCKEAQPL